MNKLRCLLLVLFTVIFASGCTSLHYNWAYTPLHDVDNGAFEPAQGKIEYRELEDIAAMSEAEREMYRQGYVMIGYSNMVSPQLSAVAPSGARQLAGSKGASVVLNTFNGNHYLATLWAKPKTFVFGAYFTDDLPDLARAALREILKTEQAVIVQTVVENSPAFDAKVRPGDLLITINGNRITNTETLNNLLRKHAGNDVTFIVWSMQEGPPRPVPVQLNALN